MATTRPLARWLRKFSKLPAIPTCFRIRSPQVCGHGTPLKDYAHTPWFGNDDQKLAVNVEIPEGDYDPVLGASYVQISREGLGYQKSQTGGGMIPKAGAVNAPYHRYASVPNVEEKERSFFDGIDVSLMGIATLAKSGNREFLKTA